MIRNGIDTEQEAGFAQLLQTTPDAGAVSVRTSQRWHDARVVDSSADEVEVAGAVLPRSHRIRVDLPEELGGGDRGPAPGELLLTALAACVTQQLVGLAASQGVDLDGVEVSCEGHLDLRGAYGIDGVRPGLSEVHLRLEVRSGASQAVVDELFASAVCTSPVADTVRGQVTVRPAVRCLV